MTSTDIHKWTIVTLDGSSMVNSDDYFGMLDKLYQHYMIKKPKQGQVANMLLMDGQVVVEKDLIFRAIEYAKTREEFVVDAITKARMEHKPEWLEVE